VQPKEEEDGDEGTAEPVVLKPVVRGLGDVAEAMRAPALADSCSEFLRLYELAMVMVPGSVEDERMFSAINFIRSDHRNRMKASHLSVCARLFKDVLFESSPSC
jgi:hypothetical protein